MKSKLFTVSCKSVVFTLAALLSVTSAKATVIALDPFTDGGRSNGGRDPLSMAWYTISNNGVSPRLSIVTNALIGSGNSPHLGPNTPFQGIVANLPSRRTLDRAETPRT